MSGVGYIGSKISLISKSDIRYVGILHSINSADSTVALEQVRSYGTEGRRGSPAEEIPPSDNIFEYIVFRGSDVKDLHVCEAPAQQQSLPPQVPNDPAILGTTAPRPPSFQSYAPPPPMGVQPPNFAVSPFYIQQVAAAASFQQQPQYWQQPHPQSQLNNNISESAAKEAEQSKQLQKEHSAPDKIEEPRPEKQSSVKNFAKTGTSSRSTVTTNNRNNDATAEIPSTSAVENLAKKVSEINLTTTKETNVEKQATVNNHARPSAPSNNRLPGMGGHLLQQNRRGGRGSRRSYNQNYDRNRIPVPQSDFDFESSNAKNKSFFDNISCETKERLEQQGPDGRRSLSVAERRQKQSEERRLNLETFGQVSIDGGRYRGSYRGRGYRGSRGGYRGSRGSGSGGYRGGYSNNFRGNNYRQQLQQQQS
ncbi:17871_t:CDS:2 [Rhizophagus irregularis]|nr:17871_t:CDS:2 [Rhizophagus irregularis]